MNPWTDPKTLIGAMQLVLTIGGGLYVWVMSRTRATRAALEEHKAQTYERLDRHGERISRLEGMAQAAPTKDQLGDLAIAVSQVEGDLKGLASTVKGLADQIETIASNVQMLVENEIKGDRRG